MFGLASVKKLKNAGVLSINARNLKLIAAYNPRSKYPLADDKLQTKKLLQQANIPVPDLFTVFDSVGSLKHLESKLKSYSSCVLKPAHGAGGEGVLVLDTLKQDGAITASGEFWDYRSIRRHAARMIAGLYSLGGRPDAVLVEDRIIFDSSLSRICETGVPDIRIIVYRGVPIMAMLRVPTRKSRGKANLHQHAIGIGINIATGTTTTGVMGAERISQHPDTGIELANHTIPYWDQILTMASRCHSLTGLGYLGVDLVLDQEQGPLILEVNARPGLAIQIANQRGIQKRVELVDSKIKELSSLEKMIEFARSEIDCA